MSQSWIEFWNWILNLTQNNLSQLFKSTVKIWAKLNIRNLVKNYPILQVRSWICGWHGSWLVLKSFSLGQVSLLWKFELNWTSGTLSRTTLSSKYEVGSVEDMVPDLSWYHLVLVRWVYCENLSSIACLVAEKSLCGWVVQQQNRVTPSPSL